MESKESAAARYLGSRLQGWDRDPALQRRRVRDLIDPAAQRWIAGDIVELRPESDLLMYEARRDALEPIFQHGLTWHADLVRYLPGVLPTGEAHRSLGHWNPATQFEVFEVVSGQIVMVVALPGERPVACQASAGELVAIPLGAWHITYVIEGPAFVFNIYADSVAGEHVKFGSDDAVRCWVRVDAAGWEVLAADGGPVGRLEAGASATTAVLQGRSLAQAHGEGEASVFAAVAADCSRA